MDRRKEGKGEWMDGQMDEWKGRKEEKCEWMEGRKGKKGRKINVSGWMSGWMGREITWKLHLPLELLLSAPFGSSVGKPDLREGRNHAADCALQGPAPTVPHVFLTWTQRAELSPDPTSPLPALALAL